MVVSCPSVHNPVLLVSHLLSWLTCARLMMHSTHSCLVRHYKTFLQNLGSPDGSAPDLERVLSSTSSIEESKKILAD